MRLIFVGAYPAVVMLSEAKHLGSEGNLRLFSRVTRILRFAQDDKLDYMDPTERSRTRAPTPGRLRLC